MRLNLGSGPDYRPGWLNVELDPTCRADLHADLRNYPAIEARLTEPVELIYMKHVLEHLSMAEVRTHLAWCFQTLQSKGQLVIDGPDLRAMCRHLALKPTWDWSDVAMLYGGQETPFDFHKAGWGPDFLSTLLGEIGFTDVQIAPVDLCFIIGGRKP